MIPVGRAIMATPIRDERAAIARPISVTGVISPYPVVEIEIADQ